MASIVLVHGIANEQLTPDGIEAGWGREKGTGTGKCSEYKQLPYS
jgi:hypothetical protein